MTQTRVLYVDHVGQIGGAEVSLIKLLEKLDPSQFYVVAAIPGAGDLTDRLREIDGLEVVLLPPATPPPPFIDALIALARRGTFDVIHGNSYHVIPAVARVANVLGTPAICHVRDLVENISPVRPHLGSLHRLIAITNAVAKPFLSQMNERCQVIYNGIDLGEFNPASTPVAKLQGELGLSPETPLVGIVGQIIPWKGQDLFLKACSLLGPECVEARFAIIGDDRFRDLSRPDFLQELHDQVVQLGINERVHFLGWRDDIPEVCASLSVLVNASTGEPFGRTIAEAMAMEVPVVAIKAGGVSELVADGETGYLVPKDNPRVMAGRIRELLVNPSLNVHMGKAGRKRMENQFSLDIHVKAITELYQEVIAEKRGN